MKTAILDITGKKAREIETPKVFTVPVREDLINRFLEIKKSRQPYSPSPVAGKQVSASGKVIHRRHVWRSGYGRGMARIPRKIISRRGSQVNWIGAEIASTRGGRRAHPPKTISMINTLKLNKKEANLALKSAISATGNRKYLAKKYEKLNERELEKFPLIIDSKITGLKTKDLLSAIEKILGKKIFEVVRKKKAVRKGKGKMRGRKYKTNAGFLIVIGKNEKLKTKAFETKNTGNLGISDLARGGAGRITLYTEQAINEIGEKFK